MEEARETREGGSGGDRKNSGVEKGRIEERGSERRERERGSGLGRRGGGYRSETDRTDTKRVGNLRTGNAGICPDRMRYIDKQPQSCFRRNIDICGKDGNWVGFWRGCFGINRRRGAEEPQERRMKTRR